MIIKNQFIQRTIQLMTGAGLAQFITLIISPILTRLYTPYDFGVLAIFLSITTILSIIFTLRYDLAIMLPKDDEDGWSLMIASMMFSFIFSILLLLLIFFFSNEILNWSYYLFSFNEEHILFSKSINKNYLFLIPLGTFFIAMHQILIHWTTRKKQFLNLSINRIIKESTMGLTQLGIGIINNIPIGLIAGQILGNIVATIILLINTLKKLSIKNIVYWKRIKKNIILFKDFPMFTTWANLLNTLSQNIPTILLFILFSAKIAGFYAIAIRILSLPIILVSNSVRQVFFQDASEKINNKQSILKLFTQTTKYLLLIATLPTLLMLLFGPQIFGLIFGKDWVQAGLFATILSPWYLLVMANSPSSTSIYLLKLNQFQLWYDCLLLLFRILAILIGYIIYESAIYSIVFVSLVGVIFNSLLIIIIFLKIQKQLN